MNRILFVNSAESNQPKIGPWFAATFIMFFGRAFIFSTWVSRGPDVKKLLDLNTFQMGVLTMLYPLGGLLIISQASKLMQRVGSRKVAVGIYFLGGISLAFLGFSIDGGNVWLASLFLIFVGSQMALADFVQNYEGNMVDKASKHSLFPAIHGAFGLGMLSAAALAGALSNAKASVGFNYTIVAIVAGVTSILAAFALPKHEKVIESEQEKALLKKQSRAVWREPRSLMIAYVGFSFIMAEIAAGTWVPIALTNSGFTSAKAAFALSLFWVAGTLGRLLGGIVIDSIGRYRTVKYSAALTVIGIALFIFNDFVSIAWFGPYLGLFVWGAGMAMGFPMSVSSMGDDPVWAAARINMVIAIVYVASISVGPLLGAAGQLFGIYVAFAIPLIISAVTIKLSTATKPLKV